MAHRSPKQRYYCSVECGGDLIEGQNNIHETLPTCPIEDWSGYFFCALPYVYVGFCRLCDSFDVILEPAYGAIPPLHARKWPCCGIIFGPLASRRILRDFWMPLHHSARTSRSSIPTKFLLRCHVRLHFSQYSTSRSRGCGIEDAQDAIVDARGAARHGRTVFCGDGTTWVYLWLIQKIGCMKH